MAFYRVVSNIKRNGERHLPGAIVELDAKEAAAMPWAIEAVSAAEAKAARQTEPEPAPDAGKAKGKGK